MVKRIPGKPITEARTHSEETLSGVCSIYGTTEAKERVVFQSAFPQLLTCFLGRHAKYKSVLLLFALEWKHSDKLLVKILGH